MNRLREKSTLSSQSAAAPLQTLMRVLSFASRALAFLVLVIYAPVIAAAGLLIACTSPGPPFVKKAYRRGNGSEETVYLYELRTECWQTWRPTPVGRLLFQFDVHRLPRLMNVLQGEVNVGERVQRLRA